MRCVRLTDPLISGNSYYSLISDSVSLVGEQFMLVLVQILYNKRISVSNSIIYLPQHILAQHIPSDMFLVKETKQLIKNVYSKFRILNILSSDV